MADWIAEPFFLPVEPGFRFCILYSPPAGRPIRGAILHVPPFAEELNKCRRMTSVMARALAADGWAVLQIDLLGCGDSSGELKDATWEHWIRDLCEAHQWLTARYSGSAWLWGLRAGGFLATQVCGKIKGPTNLLLWQPVVSGRQHLTQFLRLKVAGEMLDSGERSGVKAIRERLLAGETMHIAGYELAPTLAASLDSAELALLPGNEGVAIWAEVSTMEPATLLPASTAQVSRLRDQGIDVRTSAVNGSPFWQTVEIAECPALVEETLKLIRLEGA